MLRFWIAQGQAINPGYPHERRFMRAALFAECKRER
jgi:hypothetical protein